MNKAEKFIQDCTKNCSNEMEWDEGGLTCHDYVPWLTPDQARRAVEIAREEMIEKACEYITSNMRCGGYTLQTKSKFIKDLKQAMKKK